MTEQPYQPQRGINQPPSADSPAPPPGWAPMPLSDDSRSGPGQRHSGHTDSAPLGSPDPASLSIEEFAPPRSRLPLLLTLVAVLAAVLIWAGTSLRPPAPEATASPSPTRTANGSGLPFITPDERHSGQWEILQRRWTDSGLEVEIRIAVDRGPVSYSFVAFENTAINATEPEPGAMPPRFSGLPIQTGEEESGWLFFPLERGPATIILATAGGSQISALPVPA